MQKTVCENKKCTGCMVCIEKCPKSCIIMKDELSHLNAIIDQEKCIGCNLCHMVCPVNHPNELKKPIEWKQGWSEDKNIRSRASSGGIASAVVISFLRNGGIVYACIFKNGEFYFDQIKSEIDIVYMRGSKYVKSNPQGIYQRMKIDLQNKNNVLFIGLPCQVKAARNFVGSDFEKSLFTIDLICHGAPSSKILMDYLKNKGVKIDSIKTINFRKKTDFGLRLPYFDRNFTTGTDVYMLAFLLGLSYTEGCFNCQFAQINRAGDITIGDSWGSTLSDEEQKKGISLILCQTLKGRSLIYNSHLHLESVDLKQAISANRQLEHPTKKPKKYDIFWKGIKKGRSLAFMVFRCCPKASINNTINTIKISLKSNLDFLK